jgi:hypothetical protein
VARKSNYEKFPFVRVSDSADAVAVGWDAIARTLQAALTSLDKDDAVLAVECYPGVLEDQIVAALIEHLRPAAVLRTRDAMPSPERIDELVPSRRHRRPGLRDTWSRLRLEDFLTATTPARVLKRIGAVRG